MYEIRVQAGFSATHQLRLLDGSVEPLHGHDWKVYAVFAGAELDTIGVLVDFAAAQKALADSLRGLDHAHLNTCALLAGVNPTAEHVARVIFEALRERLPDAPLRAVYVQEAPDCIAGYCPGAQPRQNPGFLDDISSQV